MRNILLVCAGLVGVVCAREVLVAGEEAAKPCANCAVVKGAVAPASCYKTTAADAKCPKCAQAKKCDECSKLAKCPKCSECSKCKPVERPACEKCAKCPKCGEAKKCDACSKPVKCPKCSESKKCPKCSECSKCKPVERPTCEKCAKCPKRDEAKKCDACSKREECKKCSKCAKAEACDSTIGRGLTGGGDAFIWVKFPGTNYAKGKHPRVSINFAEYAWAGEFRIFRTRVPDHRARRYYIAATGGLTPRGIDIGTDDELGGERFVTLSAGETAKIQFVSAGSQASAGVTKSDLKTLESNLGVKIETAVGKVDSRLTTEVGKLTKTVEELKELKDLKALKAQLADLKKKNGELETELKQRRAYLKEHATLNFRFLETTLTANVARDANGVVSAPSFPAPFGELILEASEWPSDLGPAPGSAVPAELFLTLYDADSLPNAGPVHSVPNPLVVKFSASGGKFEASVPFASLDGELKNGIVKGKTAKAFHVRGTLRFTLANGRKTVAGSVLNQIVLDLK